MNFISEEDYLKYKGDYDSFVCVARVAFPNSVIDPVYVTFDVKNEIEQAISEYVKTQGIDNWTNLKIDYKIPKINKL